MLLYNGVAEAVERIQGGVESHVAQPHAKPLVELVTHDHLECTIAIRDLEDGPIAVTPVFAVDIYQSENSLDRT